MAQAITIVGHHGKVTIKDTQFFADQLTHPAWQVAGHIYEGLELFRADPEPAGTPERDGGNMIFYSDVGKGCHFNAHGYPNTEGEVDFWTLVNETPDHSYLMFSGTETIAIGHFNFKASEVKPYISLEGDPANGAFKNGKLTMVGAGTNPGDLYNYGRFIATEGWKTSTLPAFPPGPFNSNEEWRLYYNNEKLTHPTSGGKVVFPDGYGQQTFDDLQVGKRFSCLL